MKWHGKEQFELKWRENVAEGRREAEWLFQCYFSAPHHFRCRKVFVWWKNSNSRSDEVFRPWICEKCFLVQSTSPIRFVSRERNQLKNGRRLQSFRFVERKKLISHLHSSIPHTDVLAQLWRKRFVWQLPRFIGNISTSIMVFKITVTYFSFGPKDKPTSVLMSDRLTSPPWFRHTDREQKPSILGNWIHANGRIMCPKPM